MDHCSGRIWSSRSRRWKLRHWVFCCSDLKPDDRLGRIGSLRRTLQRLLSQRYWCLKRTAWKFTRAASVGTDVTIAAPITVAVTMQMACRQGTSAIAGGASNLFRKTWSTVFDCDQMYGSLHKLTQVRLVSMNGTYHC